MLCSRIGAEEKLLITEFKSRGIQFSTLDVRKHHFRLEQPDPWDCYDVILDRCVSYSRGLANIQILNGWGIPTVNSASVIENCGDKLKTSVMLQQNGIPAPAVRIAFTPESALSAIEEMGYPVVLKPAVGSWGRLLSKVNDRESAESILEHKSTLGSYAHSIFYIQQFVEKSEAQDIRSFVIDDETICAVYRKSEHWITNTARGGSAGNFPVSERVDELSRASASAVGGGAVAIDLMMNNEGHWMVNEVNHSMEFRNSIEPTGVDIPAKIVEYVLKVGESKIQQPLVVRGNA